MQRIRGFTLIELVMIIVILGILSAVALPKYFDILTSAKVSAEKGVVGGVRAGIAAYYAHQCATATCDYPDTLDLEAAGTACSTAHPCFVTVLSQGGITSDWTKASATTYTGPAANTYIYDNTTGEFE